MFRKAAIGLTCAIVALMSQAVAASTTCTDPGGQRVETGLRIAPVPLSLANKSRILVGMGSYLVNAVGGCNDCHTNPPFAAGGDPFQGQPKKINAARYLGGGVAFGPFISPNITPNAQGLPAGLSLTEFVTLMRTGHEPDEPGEILQVMPWPVYQSMTYCDLQSIYTYLRAIPRVSRQG